MIRLQNTYDHRLRDLVRRTGDISIATSLGVPRSTAAGWLKQSANSVVSIELIETDREELEAEVAKLRKRVKRMVALLRLLLLVGMSAARYHAWTRGLEACELDDVRSCPGRTPDQR